MAAACSAAQTVQESSIGAGVERSFDAPYEKVLDAARTALTMMHLEPSNQREDAKGFVIVFSRPPRYGNLGRLIVARSESQLITVHALYESRAILPFNSSAGFGRRLFSRMETILFADNVPATPPENPASENPS